MSSLIPQHSIMKHTQAQSDWLLCKHGMTCYTFTSLSLIPIMVYSCILKKMHLHCHFNPVDVWTLHTGYLSSKINSSKQRFKTHAFYACASLRASLTLFEASARNIELVSASSDGNTASARHFVHRGTQICAIANTKRKEKGGGGDTKALDRSVLIVILIWMRKRRNKKSHRGQRGKRFLPLTSAALKQLWAGKRGALSSHV